MNRLNWKHGNLFNKVVDLKNQVNAIQIKIDADPNNKVPRLEEIRVLKEYKEASEDEEKLLVQKVKVNWLEEGDRNSAYFHKVLKTKQNRSRILTICDEKGVSPDVCKINKKDGLIFSKTVSEENAVKMIREVSEKEIKAALFDIEDNKAPGTDGYTSYTSIFYKKAWDIVKNDFCEAVKEFFKTGKLLGKVNATLITLVPKINTPLKVSDFRPIACCNSAFIPGRAITNNILLTQELLKGYNCVNGPKRCAHKIDLQKAYDTVNWIFIKDILTSFGFPNKMIRWIMVCITTPRFTICVNGERYGYFKGGRGLRQGDPISPHLSTIVMEMLNIFLKAKIRKEKLFKYHFGCRHINITHLCFADDLLVMCHGDVPLVSKKIGVANCKVLIDKVNQELSDWKNKNLTYAGRAQLIASVLSSMQVYWDFVFLLPKTVIYDIERIFKKFLWSSGDISKGKAKVAWNVWDVEIQKNKSWGWKSILELRELVGKHMRYKISNGKSIKTMYLVDTNGWKWPAHWREKYNFLNNIPIPQLTNNLDIPVWISNDGNEGKFSTNRMWKDVRGMKGDPHDHLSFNYDYAKDVWKRVKEKAKMNWKDMVMEISKWKCKRGGWGTIRKLCFAAAVYYLWQERNRRIFGNAERSKDELLKALNEEIRNRMLSITVKHSYAVQKS
ncbi:RNA-directed DNA polymerase, eukaryota, reverse transcriptase zinc-binding domain protein [Tanacetum coccineum]